MGCGESREQKKGPAAPAPWRETDSTSWNVTNDQWKAYVDKTYNDATVLNSELKVDGAKLRRELAVTKVKDEYVVGRSIYAHESFVSWGRIMVKQGLWEGHTGTWISNDTAFGTGKDEEYKVDKLSDGTILCTATGVQGARDDVYLRFYNAGGAAGFRLGGDSSDEEEAAPLANVEIELAPGKFTIMLGTTILPTANDDGKAPNLKKLKEGDLVEIVDIQRVEDRSRIRGKLAEGGWISLKDFEGKLTWAYPEAVAAAKKEQAEKIKAREDAKKLAERKNTYSVWRLKGGKAEMNVSKGIDAAEDWKPCVLRFESNHARLVVLRDGAQVGAFKRQIPVDRGQRRYDGFDLVFGDNIDKKLHNNQTKIVCLHLAKVDEQTNTLHIVYSAGNTGRGKPGSISVPIPPAMMAEMRQYPEKWSRYKQPLMYQGRRFETEDDIWQFMALWLMMDIAVTITCYVLIFGAIAAFEAADHAAVAGEVGAGAAGAGGEEIGFSLLDFF